MDQSGGNAQPRTGSDDTAGGHPARPSAPAAAEARPAPDPQLQASGPDADDERGQGGPAKDTRPAEPQENHDSGRSADSQQPTRPEKAKDSEEPADSPDSQEVHRPGQAPEPSRPTPVTPAPQQAPGQASDQAQEPEETPAPAPVPEAQEQAPAPYQTQEPEQTPAESSAPSPGQQAPQPPEQAPQSPRQPAPQRPAARPDDHVPGAPDERERHPERSHAVAGVTPTQAAPPPPTRPKDPGGGILMGRPFGVPVYVAPSWFLVAALITWVFGGQLDRVLPELGALRYLVSLFFAVAFYASVLVHELAHTVAALRFKLPVRRIQLQFFGGVSEIEKEAERPGREFVLAFVGPLLSLVLAGVFYAGLRAVDPDTVPGVLLAGLMVSNLIVAAFNLLPGLPLDGGRMLRAVVWKITGRPMSGTVAAAWVGRALAVAVLIGLPLFTQTGGSESRQGIGMDTVTDALLAAILAAIIWTGAGNSLRMARLREHLPELRARTLTRRAIPVEPPTPLSEALRRANDAGARALVVVDARGEPLSLVREASIVGVPDHRRPWVPVSSLAQDLTEGMRVSAELGGEELLDVLRATPATEYLVVEETGEIYGVLSAADVERAFVKAMARPAA